MFEMLIKTWNRPLSSLTSVGVGIAVGALAATAFSAVAAGTVGTIAVGCVLYAAISCGGTYVIDYATNAAYRKIGIE